MKERLWNTQTSTVDYVRDAHLDHAWIVEREHDEHILERNKRIRLEGLMPKGKMAPVIDDPIQFAFSIPPKAFGKLKQKEPDIWAQLMDTDPQENLKGARRLAILHPEWTVTEANR